MNEQEVKNLLFELVGDSWTGWGANADEDRWRCFWCHAESGDDTDMNEDAPPDHDDTCPVVRARRLIGMQE